RAVAELLDHPAVLARPARPLGGDPYTRCARRGHLAGAGPALDVGLDPRAGLELVVAHRRRSDPVEPEAPGGVALGIEGVHVPPLLAVQELVRLHLARGEDVLVLLVVLELEQALLRDRPADDLRDLGVVPGSGRDLQSLGGRVAAER